MTSLWLASQQRGEHMQDPAQSGGPAMCMSTLDGGRLVEVVVVVVVVDTWHT
jgi:hypothetical protein